MNVSTITYQIHLLHNFLKCFRLPIARLVAQAWLSAVMTNDVNVVDALLSVFWAWMQPLIQSKNVLETVQEA